MGNSVSHNWIIDEGKRKGYAKEQVKDVKYREQ